MIPAGNKAKRLLQVNHTTQKRYSFWKELVCIIFELLLPFQFNCEYPYFAEGLLHNFCPCFNIVFAQLGA